jgi:integrase
MAKAARRAPLTPIMLRTEPLPEKGKTVIYDTEVGRIAVHIYPSGARAFKFIFHWKGKTKTKDLGEVSVKEARRLGYKYSDMLANGIDPLAPVAVEKTWSFAWFMNYYYEIKAENELRAFPHTRYLLGKYVPQWFNKKTVSEVTSLDVSMVLQPLKRGVRRQVHSAISSVFSWGMGQALLDHNPCLKLERVTLKPRDRVLSEEEIPKFWRAWEQKGLAGTALKVLLLTGQRISEVVEMCRGELKADGWWEIPGERTKNGLDHRVWLPEVVREMLPGVEHALHDDLIFSSKPWQLAKKMRKVMQDICTEMGLVDKDKRATPHDLRRTNGSCEASAG